MKFEDLQLNKPEASLDLKSEKVERPIESQVTEADNFDLSQEITQSKIKDIQEIQKVRQEIAAVPETEALPVAQEKNTEVTEQKTGWLASKLDTAKRYLKVATLGAGIFMGASKLEAGNNNQSTRDKFINKTEQAPNIDNKTEKSIDGGNIAEVVVYGKKKYEEEMLKQEENIKKYLADLEKYKQDSVEWLKANEAYRDSSVAHKFTRNLEREMKKIDKIYDDFEKLPERVRINYLYEQERLLKKDPAKGKELEAITTEMHKIWDDQNYINKYNERTDAIRKIEDGLWKYTFYGIPKDHLDKKTSRVDYKTIYKDIRTSFSDNPMEKSTSSQALPVNLKPEEFKLFLANHDGWNFYPYFKEPKVPVTPLRPQRNFVEKITYDPKYEDLNMRPLWATMVKKNPDEKIGTLKTLDPNFEKGFTLEEAMSFPQDIKDKYNIDYIYKQVRGEK